MRWTKVANRDSWGQITKFLDFLLKICKGIKEAGLIPLLSRVYFIG